MSIEMIEPQGVKHDSGKLDYTLLPWDGLENVVRVLEFGAQKYSRDNWRKVDNSEARYLAAAFRHLVAHSSGEVNDPESELPHMAHAACCVLFLLAKERA